MTTSTIWDIINTAKAEAKETLGTATDAQWQRYVTLCKQKMVAMKDRSEFSVKSMSETIGNLIALPNAYPASPVAKQKFSDMCKELGLKCPDMTGWSNVVISEKIQKLGELIPATERQLDMIANYYRFGLLDNVQLPGKISQTFASSLMSKLRDEYTVASDGRLTLNQAKRIVELEKKLHNIDIDIKSLSNIAFEEASDRIAKLKLEQDLDNSLKASEWNINAGFDVGYDNSRSRDEENFDSLDYDSQEFDIKLQIVKALRAIVNTDADDVDSTVNDDNIDNVIGELYKLACIIGEDKAAYGVVANILRDPAKKAVRKARK